MSNDQRQFEALLLDIGDVITAPIWDQLDELEQIIDRSDYLPSSFAMAEWRS